MKLEKNERAYISVFSWEMLLSASGVEEAYGFGVTLENKPDITEIKDRSKAENFISRYFL